MFIRLSDVKVGERYGYGTNLMTKRDRGEDIWVDTEWWYYGNVPVVNAPKGAVIEHYDPMIGRWVIGYRKDAKLRYKPRFYIGRLIMIDCEPHMLAQVECLRVAAISYDFGNRYNDPSRVENVNNITIPELKAILGVSDYSELYSLLRGTH